MSNGVRIPKAVWAEMVKHVEEELSKGPLDKPIAFALYTAEDNHFQVIGCRLLPLKLAGGPYPNGNYTYNWRGVGRQYFYSPPGSGRWFSGTWIFGDGLELDSEDIRWMGKEETPLRVKVIRDEEGHYQFKAHHLAYGEIEVAFSDNP